MQLTCSQSELAQALSLVSRAVPAKPSHAILGNILLEAIGGGGKINLTAFDLVFGIKSSIEASVINPGTVAVPAKVFSDIVSKLPNGDISLHLEQIDDGTVLRIKHKRNKYDIRVVSADEFPTLPVSQSKPIAIQSSFLLSGLRATIFTASSDESKGVLTGVNLIIDKHLIRFGSTDGHRLSTIELDNELESIPASITIPAGSLAELEKVLSKTSASEDIVSLFIDDAQVIFEWNNQRLVARALESQFPDYRQLVPVQFDRMSQCDRKELISAIDRLASLNGSFVKIHFNSKSQQMALSSVAQSTGEGLDIIDAQISGDEVIICFNAEYLIEGLKSLSSSEVQIHSNQPLKPVVFTPVGGIKQRYLMMPIEERSL